MVEGKKYWLYLPIILTPIFSGVFKMDFINSVSATIVATLIFTSIAFAFSKFIRKNIGALLIYEEKYIRLILWNEDLRKLYLHDIVENSLPLHIPDDMAVAETKIITPLSLKNNNFYLEKIIDDNKIKIKMDNFPAQSVFEMKIDLTLKSKKSVLYKSGLTICPQKIIPEANNIEFWKPEELYLKERIKDLKSVKVHLFCSSSKINFRHVRRCNRLLSWFCGIVVIISLIVGISLIFQLIFGQLENYDLIMDFISWSLSLFILGVWGVKLSNDIPFFVKKILKKQELFFKENNY